MIITDVNCRCGASYRCAESSSLRGEHGEFLCGCCGAVLARWERPSRRAYRLVYAPERLCGNLPPVTPEPSVRPVRQDSPAWQPSAVQD